MKFTNEQIEQGLDKIFDNLLQTKDVEASESMEITPDEGYAGIKKVNLTVKGGGGSASGSADEWLYVSIEDVDTEASEGNYLVVNFIKELSQLAKGKGYICPPIFYDKNVAHTDPYIYAINLNQRIHLNISSEDSPVYCNTIREVFDLITQESGVSIYDLPRLTEEEFYNLNA